MVLPHCGFCFSSKRRFLPPLQEFCFSSKRGWSFSTAGSASLPKEAGPSPLRVLLLFQEKIPSSTSGVLLLFQEKNCLPSGGSRPTRRAATPRISRAPPHPMAFQRSERASCRE